jgi:hypothetical protein
MSNDGEKGKPISQFSPINGDEVKLKAQGSKPLFVSTPIIQTPDTIPVGSSNTKTIQELPPSADVVDKVWVDQESGPEIVATASVTRQRAISIITEKLPGREWYFYNSNSFELSAIDLRAINPLVNLRDMVDVLSRIEDINSPVDGIVAGIVGNTIIETIRDNISLNSSLSNYLTEMLSKECWMGTGSEDEVVPPDIAPAIALGDLVQSKLQSGGEILAIEAQTSITGWNTDLLFSTLALLHNRVVASCRNEGTETKELDKIAARIAKQRRNLGSIHPQSIDLLQNIEYLLQGHK